MHRDIGHKLEEQNKSPFKLLAFKDYKTKNCYVHNPKVSNRNNNKNQVSLSLPPLGVTNCFQSSQSFCLFLFSNSGLPLFSTMAEEINQEPP